MEMSLPDESLITQSWKDLLQDVSHDLPDMPSDRFSNRYFPSEIGERVEQLNLEQEHLKSFNYFFAKAAYWTSLLDQLLYLVEVIEQIEDPSEEDWTDELPPSEEELFDFWNQSSYAEIFAEKLKAGGSPLEITKEMLPLFEQQVLSFFDLHLTNSPTALKTETAFLYLACEELGENPNQLILGPRGQMFELPHKHEDFPNFYIQFYSPIDGTLCYEQKGKPTSLSVTSNIEKVVLDHNKQINLYLDMPSNTPEELEEFKNSASSALEVVKKASPICYQAFQLFTNTLIGINQPGIVSFSLKELPGVSHINIRERDFVDLIDDLIHENGHHYLNFCLMQESLIYEDDEKIFYSPWREELRPIRGLYHAYCTFCWAHFLFADMSQQLLQGEDLGFNHKQRDKVFKRLLEENQLLKDSDAEMEKAYKLQKITKSGHTLYKKFQSQVHRQSEIVEAVKQELGQKSF